MDTVGLGRLVNQDLRHCHPVLEKTVVVACPGDVCGLYLLPHSRPWTLSLQSGSLGPAGRSHCSLREPHTRWQMFAAAVLGTMDLPVSRKGESTGDVTGIGVGSQLTWLGNVATAAPIIVGVSARPS